MSLEASSSVLPSLNKEQKKKAKKQKSKEKRVVIDEDGRNEGTDPHWAYKPPTGVELADNAVDAGDFDWDAVANDENLELWIVRVPEGVKPKHLSDVGLDILSSSKSKRTAQIGSITKKHASYDIWSLGEDDEKVGGDEVKRLSCLLPRTKQGGKLYLAPKPIARHIVISTRPELPSAEATSDAGETGTAPRVYRNPTRYAHPKELLTHRFMPLGSLAPTHGSSASVDVPEGAVDVDAPADVMDVDVPAPNPLPITAEVASPEVSLKKSKEGKGKKRKGEAISKSPKKAKVTP